MSSTLLPITPLKAILFDLDGTLGDTLPVVVQALQETFICFTGQVYTPAEIHAMFGPAEEGVIRPRVAESDYPAALQHYLARYAELHTGAREPFPGIIDLLAMLTRRGIRRAVITGKGPGTARISMQAMGLEPYIERLVAGSPDGADKPAAIRQVLAEWDIDPRQAAYLGDMPYDMHAAREVGVLPLGAAWAATTTVKGRQDAVAVFTSVDDLQDWILDRIT